MDARGLKEVKCPKDIKAVLQAASIIQGFIYTGVTQYILETQILFGEFNQYIFKAKDSFLAFYVN